MIATFVPFSNFFSFLSHVRQELFNNSNHTFAKWWKQKRRRIIHVWKLTIIEKLWRFVCRAYFYTRFLVFFFRNKQENRIFNIKMLWSFCRTRFSVEYETDWKLSIILLALLCLINFGYWLRCKPFDVNRFSEEEKSCIENRIVALNSM